ncbi:type IV secretion system protein [Vibrio harveyi]|uniref:type IV secretion system protein n=1 Tax=Vibrio harveyi group TaxID=717610 RepID=UPI000971918B|nr:MULTISPECIES: type IV secretion system protein [Vibrio harveyi group]ELY1989181.1 type IV secretion system protein [Vibrio harveyi]APX10119.1 hypothetical protein BWP24_28435 [Vibrio campbellii]ARR10592.1 conjugal transfer protein TraA [Vibrio campbellii]WCP78885.1 type IV secretion system protein [Vibrio parahaemolyticus]WHP52920.1 type IV secretion system protein [Vibrio parahaemolyticus]
MVRKDGYTFFSDIFDFIVNGLIIDEIYNAIESVSHLIAMAMSAGIGLYAVYFAFNLMFNRADIPIMDMMRKLALLGVVTMFALNTQYYMNNVVPIVLGAGEELGGAIGTNGSSTAALDAFATSIINTTYEIWDKSEFSFTESGNFILSLFNIVVILLGAIPFLVTTFGILLTAKVMVALLLSVGTMYICFAFFEQTRSWFQQWIGLALNYTLLVWMFPIALSIELQAIKMFVYGANGTLSVSFVSALKLALVLLSFVLISTQIPVLASSLSGGIGINGMSASFSNVIGRATGGLVGGARGAASGGRAAYRGGRWGVDKVRNMNENRKNNIKAG